MQFVKHLQPQDVVQYPCGAWGFHAWCAPSYFGGSLGEEWQCCLWLAASPGHGTHMYQDSWFGNCFTDKGVHVLINEINYEKKKKEKKNNNIFAI